MISGAQADVNGRKEEKVAHFSGLVKKNIFFRNYRNLQIYANDGASLSGSTVGMRYSNLILIGSHFGKMVTCELETPQLM